MDPFDSDAGLFYGPLCVWSLYVTGMYSGPAEGSILAGGQELPRFWHPR